MGNEILNNISNKDYFEQVGLGKNPNSSVIYKFGRNAAVGTAEEIIWDGGNGYTFLSTASKLELVSTSAEDTNLTGDGAWIVRIFGLDTNFDSIYEDVELSGLTAVETENEYIRLFRMIVIKSAGYESIIGANIGTITARVISAGASQAIILPTAGQTLMCIYTVPAGYTGLLWSVTGSASSGKTAVISLKQRNCAEEYCPFTTKGIRDVYEATTTIMYKIPITITEKTDVIMTTYVASTPEIKVSGSFLLQLVKN